MPVALRIGRRRSSLSLPTGVTTYDALSMESPDIQTPLISLKEGTDINVMLCYAAELHEVDAYALRRGGYAPLFLHTTSLPLQRAQRTHTGGTPKDAKQANLGRLLAVSDLVGCKPCTAFPEGLTDRPICWRRRYQAVCCPLALDHSRLGYLTLPREPIPGPLHAALLIYSRLLCVTLLPIYIQIP